jgi:hypothetical protein
MGYLTTLEQLHGHRGVAWEWERVVQWHQAAQLKGGGRIGRKINILDSKWIFCSQQI